ncbi:TonB-dependent receptor [Puia dinghuensis]|uniref:TonB-dependent receptor n=1 Tax=Puia dinghuensis TaxID=1792502 RepID=A0A8J2XRT0_9BACT|nr:TonB-dependent receptor [Puia dinghuensis]
MYAQDQISGTIKDSSLEEVIVTGVPRATEKRKNPAVVSVLSRTELNRNAYSNLIDAISSIPGVSEMTEGPSISKPFVRGLGYNRVVTMNDGVRQEEQQWFDEFGVEVDENTVNEVEVLKGPASLRYGSDALAGVINFLSPPTVANGTVKGKVLTEYQTNNGLLNGFLDLAGNNHGFSWDVAYTHLQAHDYQNKYDGYVWNSGYSEDNVKGIFGINRKWGYSHLILSSFDLKLGVIEGARDSATGIFKKHYLAHDGSDSMGIAPLNQSTDYYNYPIIHQHIRHYKAVLDNSFTLGKGRLNAIVGVQVNHHQEANDITKGDIYNNYFFLRTLNYDLQYLLPQKNKWDISFGVNGMQQSSEDRGIVFVLPEYDLFDIGGYGIAKRSFGKLTLSGGVRADSRTLHGKALYVDSSGNRVAQLGSSSVEKFADYHSDFSGFSGSIGLAYDLTKAFYVKLNLARGFRAPTAAESGQNGIHDGTPFYEIGDHNLKAESSLEVDATLGVTTNDVSVEITPFVNKINNYIFPEKLASVHGGDSIRADIAAGLSGPTFKYVAGDAVLSGGEVSVNWHPGTIQWLKFENSISTVSAIQLNRPDSSKYLPYTPPTKIISKLTFTADKVNAAFQQAHFSIWIEDYFEQDKIFYQFGNETVTPGYTLLNASLGTDVRWKGKTIGTLIIAGNNLTDKGYQSNMSRLKYTDVNNVTGRTGVFNMGRNISFKLIVPFDIKKG